MINVDLTCVLNGHEASNPIAWLVCMIMGGLGAIFGIAVAGAVLLLVFAPCWIPLLAAFGAGIGIGRRQKGP